jgi:DNA adenine methylase
MNGKKTFAKVNQLISYPGSKKTLGPWYVSLMPKTKYYVSVFGGTASEFIFRRPGASIEIYNDISEDLHTMWSVVRDPKTCKLLSRLILTTGNGRQQFDECREALVGTDQIRRTWAFMMLGNCGYCAPPIRKRKWCVGGNKWYSLPDHLGWWCDRMRRVQVECQDWLTLVKRFNRPDTLLFCDPPYHLDKRRSKTLYQHEMGNDAHIDLLCWLRQTKAKVMLCGYSHDMYDLLLPRWKRLERKVRCSIGKHDWRVEVLWLNFDPPQEPAVLVDGLSSKNPKHVKVTKKPR